MNRRILVLALGSLLLSLGCDDPVALPTIVSIDVTVRIAEPADPALPRSLFGPGPRLTAIATMSDGTTQDVTPAVVWTSSDTSILSISRFAIGQYGGNSGWVEICATGWGVKGCLQLTVLPGPRISVSPDSVAFVGGVAGTPPAPQILQVRNGGGGTLGGLVTAVQFAPGQPTGWLTTALAGVLAPTTLTLTPQTATLPLGVYEALVTVTSPDDDESQSPVTIPVTLTLTSNH